MERGCYCLWPGTLRGRPRNLWGKKTSGPSLFISIHMGVTRRMPPKNKKKALVFASVAQAHLHVRLRDCAMEKIPLTRTIRHEHRAGILLLGVFLSFTQGWERERERVSRTGVMGGWVMKNELFFLIWQHPPPSQPPSVSLRNKRTNNNRHTHAQKKTGPSTWPELKLKGWCGSRTQPFFYPWTPVGEMRWVCNTNKMLSPFVHNYPFHNCSPLQTPPRSISTLESSWRLWATLKER